MCALAMRRLISSVHDFVCLQRLRRLTADTRLDVYVDAQYSLPPGNSPLRRHFRTLQSAVECSRCAMLTRAPNATWTHVHPDVCR